jgi:hypothetical protein
MKRTIEVEYDAVDICNAMQRVFIATIGIPNGCKLESKLTTYSNTVTVRAVESAVADNG